MSKKKTQEVFEKEVFNAQKGNVIVLGEYKNNKEKIRVKFIDCGHERLMSPSKILYGQTCGHSKCLNKKISEVKIAKRKKSIKKEFLDADVELLSEFEGIGKKVRVRNLKCNHVYIANANNILRGSGCPKCHGFKNTDEFKKEVFEKYEKEYTILGEYVNNRTKISVKHNKCDYIWEVIPKDLLQQKRCPKCNLSNGENYIKEYLEKNNQFFEMQFRFKDCCNKIPLPFDFMVMVEGELRLIEFDGSQHFGKSNYWGDIDGFSKVKANDKIKNEYCLSNNIPLLRIPYWWLKTDRIKKELDKFILNT